MATNPASLIYAHNAEPIRRHLERSDVTELVINEPGSIGLETREGWEWHEDTGYGDGGIFADMRTRLGSPDVALIPIGAYEPRWFMADQHVNPAEAVRIFRDVGASKALGIHWGTFQLTDEAREAPRLALAAALSAAALSPRRFVAAHAGGVYDFGAV